ncbi:MAG: CAP domain-containing protein, partial [Thiotrichaceae bacterium]|nr:CAP domain-containing protein [Thiotrichaceae bacterium]
EAAFYVAVQAYDTNLQHSDFSNIGFLLIQERGENYRDFWRTVTKEISEQAYTDNDFLYTIIPDTDSCTAGVISETAQLRQLNTINEIRKLHRLPAVDYDNNTDFEVQQAALIQRANNFLSHTPAENSLCFSQAGYDGSISSNLHLGRTNSDPAEDMIGFIDDAFNVSTIAGVGHRRALLNPFLHFTSYGQVLGASAVKVFDYSASSVADASSVPDFIAFPYLRYPYMFFSDKSSLKKTPWNLTIIEDKHSLWANQHNYFADSELKVTQKDSGKLLHVDDLHSDTKGTGVPNNLSWTVANWQYDTWYSVTIDNIRYRSGEIGSIHYDVLIDYKNIIDITAPLETGDQQNGSTIQGTLFAENDKDSYEVNLGGSVTFSGSSQFSNMAFFIAVYDANKKLLAVKDETFTMELISGRYTLVMSNCDQQTCYNQSKNYSVHIH